MLRLLTVVSLMLFSLHSYADTTLVAVAANFTKPMTELAELFNKTTGHTAKLSFGSSGKFVAQIENGAPFEIFLAADGKNTAQLQDDGFVVKDSQFTYAIGKLVLWSANAQFVDEQGAVLDQGDFKHLAIADPKLAPYGAAAVEVLTAKNLLNKLEPLFVKGDNISQTQQFVSTGSAELGFIALSQVFENGKITQGSAWIVPESLYAPIRQNAVLLTKGADNPAASALLDFLKSDSAKAVIKKYGYNLAN